MFSNVEDVNIHEPRKVAIALIFYYGLISFLDFVKEGETNEKLIP